MREFWRHSVALGRLAFRGWRFGLVEGGWAWGERQNGHLCTTLPFQTFSEVIPRTLHEVDLFSDWQPVNVRVIRMIPFLECGRLQQTNSQRNCAVWGSWGSDFSRAFGLSPILEINQLTPH